MDTYIEYSQIVNFSTHGMNILQIETYQGGLDARVEMYAQLNVLSYC